ncbi:hypothetical protein L7F22_000720 [Adiantum nelumboides]|nr:hypothetical protein [Adiantum nelumboides]
MFVFACMLYDPRVSKLHSLVDDSFFPSTEFSENKVLDMLIDLGLKTSLGLKDLLDSANSVASASLVDEKRAFVMGKCLLAHIDQLGLDLEVQPVDTTMTAEIAFNSETGILYPETEASVEQKVYLEKNTKAFESALSEQVTDKQFWIHLNGIKWCPVLTVAPLEDLPWPKELTSSLASPRTTRPKSQMWHVSATMHIVDGEFCSRLMMSKLGWLEKPNLSILAMQLIELSKNHGQLLSTGFLKLETEDLGTRVAKFNKTLDEVIPTLYNLMEESLTPESAFSLKSMLEDVRWVWVGDAFVLPTQAAFVSPSHFQPYLHVIPLFLCGYRALLSGLGVKETYDVFDLANVLQQVSTDRKGAALNKELLDFVVRVLEAIYEILLVSDPIPSQSFLSGILVPDSNGFLTPAKDLIYNDAPWLTPNVLGPMEMKHFVNVNVPNDLVDRLGAKSLRYLSFVDKEMTKDLPCLSSDVIESILSKYGKHPTLLFDLLEIADKCKAQKVHVLYDKRAHPETSVLQPNLGQFQGSALTVAFEGVELTTEEVCNLQLSPSWSRRGQNNNYGAGLLSCYTLTNLLLLVSKGCLYLFDPSGSILASSITKNRPSVTGSAQGKVYTLQGTDIAQRFDDQFTPFELEPDISWEKPNVTILRMPLYTNVTVGEDGKWFRNECSEAVLDRIFKNFMYHAATSLLFLNSVEAVHISTWESEDPSSVEFFSVKIDPACCSLRNPFIGRLNKKFQLSTIFNSFNTVTKMNTIDVFINQEGNCIMDKWLVVLSFGCGQTKALAVDSPSRTSTQLQQSAAVTLPQVTTPLGPSGHLHSTGSPSATTMAPASADRSTSTLAPQTSAHQEDSVHFMSHARKCLAMDRNAVDLMKEAVNSFIATHMMHACTYESMYEEVLNHQQMIFERDVQKDAYTDKNRILERQVKDLKGVIDTLYLQLRESKEQLKQQAMVTTRVCARCTQNELVVTTSPHTVNAVEIPPQSISTYFSADVLLPSQIGTDTRVTTRVFTSIPLHPDPIVSSPFPGGHFASNTYSTSPPIPPFVPYSAPIQPNPAMYPSQFAMFPGYYLPLPSAPHVAPTSQTQGAQMPYPVRFLAYNLSPVAGVAALVSRNGLLPPHSVKSTILCPLPLSVDCRLPVTILGCFIVSHDGYRHIFPNFSTNEISVKSPQTSLPIHSMWNQELMACVCEAYVQLLSETMFAKQEISSKKVSHGNSQIPTATWKLLSKQSYLLWPMTQKLRLASSKVTEEVSTDALERDWLVKLLVRPIIVRLADLPVWKLHGGFLARATEGMFLSNPGRDQLNLRPPEAVCEFLKEHYKVFEVPCELTEELQDAQVNIKVITPKMVRYLMCTLSTVPKFSTVDRYIDLLEYSFADFSVISVENQASPESSGAAAAPPHEDFESDSNVQLFSVEESALLQSRSSSGVHATERDPSDIVTNIRRAFSQFGKAVEELSTEASQKLSVHKQTPAVPGSTSSASSFDKWISELKGLPCPTAAANILRLGKTEAWLGSFEQQKLLMPLAAKFIHTRCLDRPLLSEIFRKSSVQQALNVKPFTAQLLLENMAHVLPRQWNKRASQWVEWDYLFNSRINSPTKEWLCLFWEHVGTSPEKLLLFQQWPLLPAVLGNTVLVKVQYRHLIFIPPEFSPLMQTSPPSENSDDNFGSQAENLQVSSFKRAYTEVQENHPWLFPFLLHCKVPIFDQNFLDNEVVKACFPSEGQTLSEAIRLKLLAAKDSGNLVVSELNLAASDCDALFSLFAKEFHVTPSIASSCTTADFELLRSLPIYKTTNGTYTSVDSSVHCILTPTAFFKPQSDLCLQHFPPDQGGAYCKALGIQELSNSETLVKFCFPLFSIIDVDDRERVLSYVYTHWEDLQHNEALVDALKSSRFVTNGEENDGVVYQAQDLLDPTVPLFKEVFMGKKSRFPNARFITNRWLDILRKAGLCSTLDAAALIDCAREVEDLGQSGSFAVLKSEDFKEVSTEVFSTAGHVVEAILANFASLYGNSFFEPLSEIAFVPTEMGLPFKNESGRRRVLASYKQVVMLKDWPLAWTCAPILTNTSLMPPEFSWHSLHLKSPPCFETVLKHIQNVGEHDGEDILARWPSADIMTVEDAFLEILKYLEKHWKILSLQDKLVLEKIPFIPIANGTRLCLPSRIFLHLEMNLAPFMFQLPNSYLPFVKLLTELGMEESPTLSRLQALLSHVKNASGYQRLNPNELCAVMKLLKHLCKVTTSENQHHLLTRDSVVLDDAGRLLHAQACVYIDASASTMVSKIDTSRLRFVHPYLHLDHCICLGVRKLSEVVMEVLDESLPLEYTNYFGNISKAQIIEKLKSASFQDAVWTLLQDFSREMPSVEPLAKQEVARKLLWSAENLDCVKQLRTRFYIVNGKVDITKEKRAGVGSPAEAYQSNYEFIDKQNGRIILAEPPDYLMISEIISVMISKVLGSPACLPLSGLFNVAVGLSAIM